MKAAQKEILNTRKVRRARIGIADKKVNNGSLPIYLYLDGERFYLCNQRYNRYLINLLSNGGVRLSELRTHSLNMGGRDTMRHYAKKTMNSIGHLLNVAEEFILYDLMSEAS